MRCEEPDEDERQIVRAEIAKEADDAMPDDELLELAIVDDFKLGYAAGRAGKPLPKNASETFRAGWARGDSAADEAAGNGHQAWGY